MDSRRNPDKIGNNRKSSPCRMAGQGENLMAARVHSLGSAHILCRDVVGEAGDPPERFE